MRNLGFTADLRHMLVLRDARAAENAATRQRCRANSELCAYLLAEAQRYGQSEIDWIEYFRNSDINYP